MKRLLSKIPTGVLTAVVLGAILWLTLAPHPTGDIDLPLFPGADKVVHGILFLGLSIAALIDIMKRRGWRMVPLTVIGLVAFAASIIGIGIELAQEAMGMGRTMETLDILADCGGAFLGAGIWAAFQSIWASPNKNNGNRI